MNRLNTSSAEPAPLARSRKKTTLWNVAFQYSAIAIIMASGLILAPLYLKALPLELYGSWLAIWSVMTWFTAIDQGLAPVLQQQTAVLFARGDRAALRDLIGTGLFLSVLFSVFFFVGGFFLFDPMFSFINLGPEHRPLLKQTFTLAMLGASFNLFSFSIKGFNAGMLASLSMGLVHTIVYLSTLILTIVLLLNGYGLWAMAYSFVFRGVGCTLGYGLYMVWRLRKERIRPGLSREAATMIFSKFSYSFYAQASTIIGNQSDAFIVARYLGPDMVPLLTLTKNGPEMSRNFVERPTLAFMPAISNLYGVGDLQRAAEVLVRLGRILLWFSGLIFAGFFLFNQAFVSLWVGPELFAGFWVNTLICFAVLLKIAMKGLANLCFALGDIKRNSLMEMVQNAVIVLLIFFGVRHYGIAGAVAAPILGILCTGFWYYPRTFRKLLELKPTFTRSLGLEFLITTSIVTILIAFFFRVDAESWLAFGFWTLLFVLCYGASLLAVSPSFRGEIQIVYRWLAAQTRRFGAKTKSSGFDSSP